jgi:hypothetical protein
MTRWQNFKGTVIVVSILVGFTLFMWPYTLCVLALRALKKNRGL